MRMFSDIYSYSKIKSGGVFSGDDSGKAKKVPEKKEPISNSWNWFAGKGKQPSWYQRSWRENMPTVVPASWKVSVNWNPRRWFQSIAFPKWSMPSCSCISLEAVTAWFKMLYSHMEAACRCVRMVTMDLRRNLKQRVCACPCVKYMKFNSNPEYASLPWCKRAYFSMRDLLGGYVSAGKNYCRAYCPRAQPQTEVAKDGAAECAPQEEERSGVEGISQESLPEEKNEIKHSQSSKCSIDQSNADQSRRLKKTHTDDMKGSDEVSTTVPVGTSASEQYRNETESRQEESAPATVTKSESVYIDAQEEKIPDGTEAPRETEETANVPNSNEVDAKSEQKPTEENPKFIIKKTWDRFSKIIS